MNSELAITIRDLSKTYRIYHNPYDRLIEALPWSQQPRHRPVHALRDITFDVPAGTCVGLIGGNGSGKSTMLKILTGTSDPTSGSFAVRGRVASLLELGAGFHQDFTGRENIFMNAALMGFSRAETKKKFNDILEFSELQQFIDEPVRTYSSGMICRLGFSVAVAVDPDVLIIDEILAVGDMHFQRKCIDKILSYKEAGKTLFFCSHSLYDVRQICDRAIWLKEGVMQMYDDSVVVTNEYATYENQIIASQDAAQVTSGANPGALADGADGAEQHARIVSAELFDPETDEPRNTFAPDDRVGVRAKIRNGEPAEALTLGVMFSRSDGTTCFAPTTSFDGVQIGADFQEGTVTLILPRVRLLSGRFIVAVALLDGRGVHRFHQLPCTEDLIVQNRTRELGLFYVDREWTVRAD